MKTILSIIATVLLVGTMSTAAMADQGSGASHGAAGSQVRHTGGFHGGGVRHTGGYHRHYAHRGYHSGGYYGPDYGYDDDGLYGNPAAAIIGGIIGGAFGDRL